MLVFLGNQIFDSIKSHPRVTPSSEKVNLETTLSQGTNLNVNKIDSKKQASLEKLVEDLNEDKFFGAYLAVKNEKLVLATRFGVANAKIGNVFRLNSPFVIGDLQTLYNNAMLLKLVQDSKIDLDEDVRSYLPELKMERKITVRDLLFNKVSVFVKSKYLNEFETPDFLRKIKKSNSKDSVLANDFIKGKIISKVDNMTYADAFESLITEKMGLTNSRVITSNSLWTNDVLSYKYMIENKLPVQKDEIDIKTIQNSNYTIRMSLSDLALSTNKMLKSSYLNKKMAKLYKKSMPSSYKQSNGYLLSTSKSGQYIKIKTDSSGKNMLIVASNFPNKKMLLNTLLKRLQVIVY
ncbi:hypothetical protein LXEBMM8_EKPBGFGD_01053 [Lactiplantibacillus xiangfangensis]